MDMAIVMDMIMVTTDITVLATLTPDMVGVVVQAAGLEGGGVGGHLATPHTGQAQAPVHIQVQDQEQLQVCINRTS